MAQLLTIGTKCYLSDINYQPYDPKANIDCTLIEERLAAPVMTGFAESSDFLNGLSIHFLMADVLTGIKVFFQANICFSLWRSYQD